MPPRRTTPLEPTIPIDPSLPPGPIHPKDDRQQPRLERDRLREPLYVGQRLDEIAHDYQSAIGQRPAAWMRDVARELLVRADNLDNEISLFPDLE